MNFFFSSPPFLSICCIGCVLLAALSIGAKVSLLSQSLRRGLSFVSRCNDGLQSTPWVCPPPAHRSWDFRAQAPPSCTSSLFALPLRSSACRSTPNGYTCSPCFGLNHGAKWRKCQSAPTSEAVNRQKPLRVRVYFLFDPASFFFYYP